MRGAPASGCRSRAAESASATSPPPSSTHPSPCGRPVSVAGPAIRGGGLCNRCLHPGPSGGVRQIPPHGTQGRRTAHGQASRHCLLLGPPVDTDIRCGYSATIKAAGISTHQRSTRAVTTHPRSQGRCPCAVSFAHSVRHSACVWRCLMYLYIDMGSSMHGVAI